MQKGTPLCFYASPYPFSLLQDFDLILQLPTTPYASPPLSLLAGSIQGQTWPCRCRPGDTSLVGYTTRARRRTRQAWQCRLPPVREFLHVVPIFGSIPHKFRASHFKPRTTLLSSRLDGRLSFHQVIQTGSRFLQGGSSCKTAARATRKHKASWLRSK